jgi:hypothetical protein
MDYKTGDKVRFLNDVGEGVVKFIRGDKIFVETSDGFEIPVKPSELIPGRDMDSERKADSQAPLNKNTGVRKEVIGKTSGTAISKIAPPVSDEFEQRSGDIMLGVVPTNPFSVSVSDFEIYLINDSDWDLQYYLCSLVNKQLMPIATGELEAGVKLLLETFSQTRISKENLRLQLLFKKEGLHQYKAPLVKDILMGNVAFYKQKSFSPCDFFDTPAFLDLIADTNLKTKDEKISLEDLKTLVEEKNSQKGELLEKKAKPIENPETEQVDLHIHEIIENTAGLEPNEILKIQMGRFTTSLEGAISAHQKRIIFVHGIGNGRLKFEIRKKLDTDYPKLKYQDASFQEYGFGATLVFIH